jgi:hypothetical protein
MPSVVSIRILPLIHRTSCHYTFGDCKHVCFRVETLYLCDSALVSFMRKYGLLQFNSNPSQHYILVKHFTSKNCLDRHVSTKSHINFKPLIKDRKLLTNISIKRKYITNKTKYRNYKIAEFRLCSNRSIVFK